MRKGLKIKFIVLAVIISMFSAAVPCFADDDDGVSGTPKVMIVNGPTFNLSAGTVNEVELQLKNVSAYAAKSIVIQPGLSDAKDPFAISFATGSKSVSIISANATKKIELSVEVDKTAESKIYAVPITYTYYNNYMVPFTSTDTIYFKITNPYSEPVLTLEDFKVTPDYIAAGDSGTISAFIVNSGSVAVYDLDVSISNLDTNAISISNGVNTQNIKKIDAGTRQSVSFGIATNADMASGNYPLTLKLKFVNSQGTSFEQEMQVFVNVGGASGANKGILEITDMVEPAGSYGVNQNFPVKFNLKNTGEGKARNITVSAEPAATDGSIIAKSASIKTLNELAAGDVAGFEFNFAATSVAVSNNYPIMFTVEYETTAGTVKTFKQYAAVNIEADGSGTSKPKLIVSEYRCDPMIVMAGEEFDLYLTFQNTHPSKTAKNIKMYLTMAEETSTDSTKTGNIFTPVNSSNTFYFTSIAAGGKADKTLRLFVVPDAQPKTYTLTVNFEYEDSEGKEYTSTELLGINVKQITEVQTGDIYIPEQVEFGMPISLSFDIYNTGKVTINNLMVVLDGDISAQSKSTYIGNCESGYTEYYDGSFTLLNEGTNNVKVIVSYDDSSNEHVENVYEFTVEATAPVPMEMDPAMMDGKMGMDPGMEQKSGSPAKVIIIIVIIVVGVIVVLKVLKKRKEKKEHAFLAAYEDENEEGKDINEDR